MQSEKIVDTANTATLDEDYDPQKAKEESKCQFTKFQKVMMQMKLSQSP